MSQSVLNKPSGRGKISACCVLASACVACIDCLFSCVRVCMFWIRPAGYLSSVYMATSIISSPTWLGTSEGRGETDGEDMREMREYMEIGVPGKERCRERCDVTLKPPVTSKETRKKEDFLPAV